MSILEKGAAFLSEKRHSDMSVDISYIRPNETPISIKATPGRAGGQDTELSGYTIDAERVDWIIRVQDLVIGGNATEPREGDQIGLVAGGVTMLYEINRDDSEKAFIYCDEFKLDYRVHSIQGVIS